MRQSPNFGYGSELDPINFWILFSAWTGSSSIRILEALFKRFYFVLKLIVEVTRGRYNLINLKCLLILKLLNGLITVYTLQCSTVSFISLQHCASRCGEQDNKYQVFFRFFKIKFVKVENILNNLYYSKILLNIPRW